MAQLKDTVVSGSLRATDTLYTSTLQTSIIKAPSSSSGSDYAAGTAGYVLKSGGANGKVYWAADSAGVTSVRVQATSPVVSSVNTALGSTLDTTISLANNYGDTKNPYASKTKNTVLAAGATADSVPSFRALVANDIPTLTPGKVGLGNVTNHALVTSLAYDSTNRKITYKISEGTATDLITFGSNAFTSFSNQITIGSKTITLGGSATLAEIGVNYPVTSVNNKTGAVTISASDLGLSNAMHFIGIATVAYTASNFPNISGYSTPTAGDVVIDKDKKYEYVYVDSTNKWELLGSDESYALSSAVINKSIITAKGDIIYGNASADPTILAGNTTTTVKFLSMASSTPSWVTLLASDIPSIPKSKISDFSHTHGNITNDGKIGSTANYAVYTTTGGTVTASSFTVNSPTASGTATSFIATVSQDSKGQITATKASLPTASTTTAGITTVGASGGAAAYSHGTHVSYGTSAAAVSTSASAGSAATVSRSDHVHNISLASGDSNGQVKIAGQNVAVTGLQSGAFTTAYVHPTSAGNIHLPSGGATGNFLKYGGSSGTGIWKDILTNDVKPIQTKTYTDIIATANDQNGAGFFYAKVRGTTYDTVWHVKVRVTASVPSNVNFYATSIYDLWGTANTYLSYRCQNAIKNTSYRPLYYNTLFRVNSTGYINNMGSWIGFSLFYANSPTDTSLKRTVVIDLLEYDNCAVEMQDSLITPTNIPNRTTSGYYNSTNTAYDNFDFYNNGLRETGDDNSTSISTLYRQYGGEVAANLLCRYQFIFENADHKFVSLFGTDNAHDTTNKTLLTVDFDPNGRIYYHYTSGTTAANANIDPGRLYYSLLADLRYTFNVTSSASSTTFTGVRYTPLYLRTRMTASTGMVHVDGNLPLTTTLPTSNDGCYYIYLGQVHDWYRVMLEQEHPVYYHNGTEIIRYYGKLIGGTAVAANSVPLSGVSSADDLKAIEALSGTSGFLKKTAANTWTLDTSSYVTSSGVTSITPGNGLINGTSGTSLSAITTTGTISINGLDPTNGSTSKWLNLKGGWSTPSAAIIGAATTNHTHDVSITLTGTATVTLAANTTYSLTAGGKTVIFKTPADSNTWNAMGGATSTANGTVGYINAAPPKDGYNTKYWRADGSWAVPYTHPTGDGNLHVPATGTGNNGKVLKAGSTAGSLSWGTLSASDVGAAPSSTISCTTANVKSALGTGSGTTKFLREDGSWLTPAYIANAAYGNISTSGTITSNGVALANGDYLLFSDASNNGKIERTSITIGTATNTWLRNDGTWATPTKTDISLGNVENTKLSTWTGSTYISTVGTVTSGTWQGTAIGSNYLTVMTGATSSTAGSKGAVPAPAAGDLGKVLNGAGNWIDKSPSFKLTTTATKIYLLGTTVIPRSSTQAASTLLTPGDESAEHMYMDSTTNTLVAPNATFGGSVTAASFSGSGAGLTNIPASAVASMTGATSSTAGTAGIIPAPAAGDLTAFLQGDATWYKLNIRNGSGTGSIVLGGVGEQGSNSLPTATADNAYALGVWTTASGKHSHAEGYGTTASGNASHSEGSSTIASGWTSHALGSGTIANHAYLHVFGEYNIGDTSTAAATERGNFIEIVGNGTASNARSNARVLDWYGNEYVAGILEGTNHTWHVNGTSKATSYYNTSDDSIVFIFV